MLRTGFLLRGRNLSDDHDTFRKMKPHMQNLWRGLRFLTDLSVVWPMLEAKERTLIERSSVRMEKFHESLIRENRPRLLELAEHLRSYKYRKFKNEIVGYLKECEQREPDQLKIYDAMMTAAIGD